MQASLFCPWPGTHLAPGSKKERTFVLSNLPKTCTGCNPVGLVRLGFHFYVPINVKNSFLTVFFLHLEILG